MTQRKPTKHRPKRAPGEPAIIGRPSLLTEDTHRRIVELVRAGNFPETAAAAAGVARPTLRHWLREGGIVRRSIDEGRIKRPTKREATLLSFLTDLEKAIGESDATQVLLIGKASKSDWRAAAWLLERRNKEHWAPFQKVEQTSTTMAVNVDAGKVQASDAKEAVKRAIERLAARTSQTQDTESTDKR